MQSLEPIRIHGAKVYGYGIEYYTLVFEENQLILCKLIEKLTIRRHKYSTKIDEMIMRVRIERGDYGLCRQIPYDQVRFIDYKTTQDEIIVEIKLKGGEHYIFHINPKKKKYVQKGVNYVKKLLGLK